MKINSLEVQRRIHHRGQTDHLDYFEHIISADEPAPTEKKLITHLEQIAGQLLVASWEPVSNQCYSVIYFLLQNQGSYEMLVKEIRGAFQCYGLITPDSVANLKFLHACLHETFRLHHNTADGLPRVSPGAVVDGTYIPKGVICQSGYFAAARSNRFFADALEYRPQRWLSPEHPAYEAKFKNDDLKALMPFNQGPRACPGSAIAWATTKLFLAKVLWSFDLVAVPNQDIVFDKHFTFYSMWEKPEFWVVISFIASGWLTVGIVLCNYLFVFDPEERPFRDATTSPHESRTHDGDVDAIWTPNPLDVLISRLCRTISMPPRTMLGHLIPASLKDWLKRISTREKAEDAFRQCVMSLCDTQLLTGISMLLSGYSSLLDVEYMTLTSWLMVANLAWFSNLTHQCGLVFLRGYLYRNPNERMWRLLLMTVLFFGLASAMTPTIGAVVFDSYYGAQPSTPAVCFYNLEVVQALYADGGINQGSITGARSFQISSIATTVLFLSFAVRLIKLFETSSRFVRLRIRAPIGRMIRRWLRCAVKTRITQRGQGAGLFLRVFCFENVLIASYMFLHITADICTSVFADVAWLLLSAIFGTKQLAFQRDFLSQLGNDQLTFEPSVYAEHEINRFDFGQVLPLMLLAGVALATRQAFQSGRSSSEVSVSTVTVALDGRKDTDLSAAESTLIPPSEAPSRIEHLLSRDIYLENVWLLPTLFNIGFAIFLFFQLIVSSSGGNAASLFISIAYSTAVVCIACSCIIMVGLVVDELSWGRCLIWGIAVQPLAAISWLSAVVMTHGVSFGDREQLMILDYERLEPHGACAKDTQVHFNNGPNAKYGFRVRRICGVA
ncbi:hypothetical protein E8E14_000616 [Neopestalotiopsis sp. 37M]|nr:hypothetical protein E8E14_000616 [Neopestalotiopsis sp. 37M]